jgi:hypothetical protein
MTKYSINVRTTSHIADSTEVNEASLTSLRLQMAKFVGELLRDHAELLWSDQDWQIDVTDESGLILYVIHLSAQETAATSGTIKRD